jgi:hypothetical protein
MIYKGYDLVYLFIGINYMPTGIKRGPLTPLFPFTYNLFLIL